MIALAEHLVDGFHTLSIILCVITGVAIMPTVTAWMLESEDEVWGPRFSLALRVFVSVFFVSLLLAVFIPGPETRAEIAKELTDDQ